jgi:hypothetical protein
MFFFEKKNQKTFVLGTRERATSRKEQKFFAELFFKKATACFGATT